MTINDRFRKPKKSLAEFIQTSFIFVIIVQLSIIGIPYIKDIIKDSKLPPPILCILIIVHLIFGGISLFATLKIKSFIQATNIDQIEQDYKALEARSNQQDKILSRYILYMKSVQWSLSVLESQKYSENKNLDAQTILYNLLEPLLKYRDELFDYNGGDLYNIAVYLYNAEEDLLKPYFRRCDDRIERHDRDWKPLFGHIGYTYWAKNLTITTEYPGQASATTANELEHDRDFYASCIAVPIPGKEEDDPLIGVFIITSSRSYQFDRDDSDLIDFMMIYTMILSQYFANYWKP